MAENYYNSLAIRAATDEEAFEELYEYFFPRVYNFIYARLKNSADADDVTSITFMKMNENLDRYDPSKSAFSTCLFRIATNSLIDHTRRSSNTQETEWEEFFDPAAPDYQEPEAQTLTKENNCKLLEAVGNLNERERRIIELRYWGEQDTHTVAEILGMTESNVRVTLHRALGKLKNILGE